MSTVAKLLARKQALLQRLQRDPGPNEREEIEALIAQIETALTLLGGGNDHACAQGRRLDGARDGGRDAGAQCQWWVVAAAAALGEIAHPDGEVFLAVIADDPDPDVRKNARWALQQIVAKKAKANS
ncbi:hypothetical protein BSN85_10695 [Bradyrhizobium brasilense]|nr:hypothetical protein BSN85_10695 [Bradyrhizobium brasilense]